MYNNNNMNKTLILPIQNEWTIYTKSNCDYCTKVKKILENESYTLVNCDKWLETQDDKTIFLDQMKKIIGYEHKTFPMVFNDKKFIGGFYEVEKYLSIKFTITDDF